jgi:DNA-directed RNA polymerase subunit RPC12/RpoP
MARETHGGDEIIECPRCQSRAVYKNGKTYYHLQRYLCLICGRQFVPGHHREYPGTRPLCPACGAKTHVFKRKEGADTVFRCSGYPLCRTYVRVAEHPLPQERRNGK